MLTPHARLESFAARYSAGRADRWAPVAAELDAAIAADESLRLAALEARRVLPSLIVERLGGCDAGLLQAVVDTPRERFVLPEDIALSAEDVPLSLEPTGVATISAPHAYVLTFRLLALSPGDHLLELGTGSGYGAALGRAIVGPRGHVTTIEIDSALHARSARLLAGKASVIQGDGHELAPSLLRASRAPLEGSHASPVKVAVTYAVSTIPDAIANALPEGGILVAPVGTTRETQELVRLERIGGALERSLHGAVRYVYERHA